MKSLFLSTENAYYVQTWKHAYPHISQRWTSKERLETFFLDSSSDPNQVWG